MSKLSKETTCEVCHVHNSKSLTLTIQELLVIKFTATKFHTKTQNLMTQFTDSLGIMPDYLLRLYTLEPNDTVHQFTGHHARLLLEVVHTNLNLVDVHTLKHKL